MNTHASFESLKSRFKDIFHLRNISNLLSWDQSTYMPEQGEAARGQQLAIIGQMVHERTSDPSVGEWIASSESFCKSQGEGSLDFSYWRIAKREYDRATKVSGDFTHRLAEHQATAYGVWARARGENNFAKVQPYLEKTLDLSREYSNFFPGYDHVADPLINTLDYGVRTKEVQHLFSDLRKSLIPLLEQILAVKPIDDSCLRHDFDEAAQIAFSKQIITLMGYEWNRGRLDKTHHPFMVKFSTGDVRITTRVRTNYLAEALFSTIHEAGHALYELGVDRELEGTPLCEGTSSGVHESQSRLWENIVARGRPFWKFAYPLLQEQFPAQLKSVPLETFYRAINKVSRSLIRTDADEVTYNLHVMIRFDLETALLEGKLAVKDLPAAWNDRYKSDLRVTPATDAEGCMQDVHWYAGCVGGMFQCYTIGNILSSQFYDAALKAHPQITSQIEKGEFSTLREWLRRELHTYGARLDANEIVKKSTGQEMTTGPYLNYLRTKFGDLYAL